MYQVSDAYLSAIRARTRTHRLTGTIVLTDGTEIPVSHENIKSGSVEIEKSCATGEELQFGNVILSELRIAIITDVSRYLFFKAKVSLNYELQLLDGTWETVPLGTFLVGEADRKNDAVSMIAYDNLISLDEDYGGAVLHGTPYEILIAICERCGMILANTEEEILALPNGEEIIQIDETSDCDIYRDCVKIVCQLTGTFAIADRDGLLKICQYHKTVDATLEPSDRYSLTAADFEVNYIGLIIKSSKAEYSVYVDDELSAENGLEMTMANAPAWDYGLQETLQARAQVLLDELVQIRYTPCDLSMVADPRYDCGDRITLVMDDGTASESLITKIQWKLGKMSVESTGKNPLLYGMTPKKAQVIRELQTQTVENKLIFYSFTNQNAITVSDSSDEKEVSQVTFATTKATSAMFMAQLPVIVEAADTVTTEDNTAEKTYTVTPSATVLDADGNPATFSVVVTDTDTTKTVTPGYVDLVVEYYLMGTLVDYELIHRCRSGGHIIGLFYTFASLDGDANYQWQIKIRVSGGTGTVTVPKRGFRATITGQGLAGTDKWDGTLNFDESVPAISLMSRMSLPEIAETVTTETQIPTPADITETVAPISLRSGLRLVGITERVSTTEIREKKTIDTAEWEYSERYVQIDSAGIMARMEWTYESAEQSVDSGRMTAVKGITNDLTSVEEVTVSG